MVLLVADARAQWAELDRRIAAFDAEFVRLGEGERKQARRLTTIPGIGAIVASALVAAVGQAESSPARARSRCAGLGLVPRQFTTGGKPKLLGISVSCVRKMVAESATRSTIIVTYSDKVALFGEHPRPE